jgi:pimeloyl-ACP methyl ester carboxylesterase
MLLASLLLVQAVSLEPIELPVRDGVRVKAEAGRFTVPERRSTPASGTLELHFVRFRSTAQQPTEPIVYLAGGPGDAGTGDFQGMPAALIDSLRTVADLIVLDQRGTGWSEPRDLGCEAGPTLPLNRPGNPARDLPLFRAHARRCVEGWRARGIDLAAFTTEENADDVEALRLALGANRLALLAGSYGSHLALAVVRRYPGSISRLALFGIEGPDHTFKRPSLVDQTLARLGQLVATDTFYRHQLPDFAGSVRRLVRRLEARPESVVVNGQTIVVGAWDLQKRITDALGRNGPMRQLPAEVVTMERGDFTALGRWVAGWRRGSGWSAMALTMDCASWASTERLALLEREARTAVVGGAVNHPFPGVCEGLGIPRLSGEFRGPLRSNVPALLVAGDLDARTPVANAEEVARGFSRAAVLVVENGGHGIMGYPAVNPSMLAFLRGQSSLPPRVALPRPAFGR